MKRILGCSGLFIMLTNAISVPIILIIVLPELFRSLSGTELISACLGLSGACAVFLGLSYLGYRLLKKFPVDYTENNNAGSKYRPKKITPKAPIIKMLDREFTLRCLVTLTPSWYHSYYFYRLYSDPYAETIVDEGTKTSFFTDLYGVISGNDCEVVGGYYENGKWKTEKHILPKELLNTLTIETLEHWVLDNFKYACNIPFKTIEESSLKFWVSFVRYLKMAEIVEPPFDILEADNEYDDSSVDIWLKPKEGADISEMIHFIAEGKSSDIYIPDPLSDDYRTRNKKNTRIRTTVILLEDPEMLSVIPDEELELCRKYNIWLGLLIKNGIKDLVTGIEYALFQQTWFGSADDAETNVRWSLVTKKNTADK